MPHSTTLARQPGWTEIEGTWYRPTMEAVPSENWARFLVNQWKQLGVRAVVQPQQEGRWLVLCECMEDGRLPLGEGLSL